MQYDEKLPAILPDRTYIGMGREDLNEPAGLLYRVEPGPVLVQFRNPDTGQQYRDTNPAHHGKTYRAGRYYNE